MEHIGDTYFKCFMDHIYGPENEIAGRIFPQRSILDKNGWGCRVAGEFESRDYVLLDAQ